MILTTRSPGLAGSWRNSEHVKNLREFREGGKPLIGAVVGAGCGLSSISFYTHGVFVSAISEDMPWSRGQVQLGVTIMILMAVITAPAIGSLIDRFTARRIALASIPLYGITLASLSFTTEAIWSYYLLWACMAILAAGTLPITWTRVVNAWFDDYRGIALGITLAGTGIAATFAPTYVTWLIGEVGWRGAYLVLAATVTAISLPGVYFLFTEPVPQYDVEADQSAAGTGGANRGITLQQAIGGYRFWALGIALFLVAAGISGLITNLVPLLVDKGLTTAGAAGYAGLIGVSVIVGRLLAGILVDHIWAPLVAAIFLSSPCIAAMTLAGPSAAPVLIGLSALIIGLAAGAELDLLAFLASRYFGLEHYGAIYGALYVFFSIGAGLAPAVFGRAFDVFGNYQVVLYLVAIMSVLGAVLMLTLGRYPQFDKPARPGS
jgi:predicted MFS family arabinose efflux permease